MFKDVSVFFLVRLNSTVFSTSSLIDTRRSFFSLKTKKKKKINVFNFEQNLNSQKGGCTESIRKPKTAFGGIANKQKAGIDLKMSIGLVKKKQEQCVCVYLNLNDYFFSCMSFAAADVQMHANEYAKTLFFFYAFICVLGIGIYMHVFASSICNKKK